MSESACTHYDAVVIGLGWSGVSALVELNSYRNTVDPSFSFIALEANNWIGGRAGSASALSGSRGLQTGFEVNPLVQIYEGFSDPYEVGLHRMTWREHEVFDEDGVMRNPPYKRNVRRDFNEAWECVNYYAKADTWLDGSTSIEAALEYCDWVPPTDPTEGSWENIYNDLNIGVEFLERGNKLPVFYFEPLWTYEDFGPFDLFIQHPFAGAKLAEDYLKGSGADNHYRLNTEVTDINWCPLDGGKAKIYTSNGDCYETNNIVSTLSAGVLHNRGDDMGIGDRMFTPPLPFDQMQATRDILVQDGRKDLDRYVELFVQFDDATWDSLDDTEGGPLEHSFLYIETGSGKRGHCNKWQAMDRTKASELQDQFWPGSHAFVCWIITPEVDELTNCPGGGPGCADISDDQARELIGSTLRKVLGLDEDVINGCVNVHKFPFLGVPNHANAAGQSCVFSIEGDGYSKFFATAYGGGKVGGWDAHTYKKAIQSLPEEGNSDPTCPNTTMVFAGDHTCRRYWGYMHGALLSGRKAVKELLGWNGVQPFFCDDFPMGGAFDDPHFKTWAEDKYYDFMGACDLHLVDAPHFATDLPLVIDIRTKIRYWYSYIERVVVQIGNETLEVGSFGEHFLNGVDGGLQQPNNKGTGVLATLSGFPVNFTRVEENVHKFEIQLGGGETLTLKTHKDMVSVLLDNASVKRFVDSKGMMGEFGSGRMMSRDGKTILEDPIAFAAEWQVRQGEPMLFQTVDGPQHPQACQMPSTTQTSRQLRGSIPRDAAEKACAKWSPETKEGCVKDVMATGDVDLAVEGGL